MSHLCSGELLDIGSQVISLHAQLGLLLLQLQFGPLQGVNLLAELRHRIRVLLPQRGGCGLVLKPRLVQLPPQLQEIRLSFPVQNNRTGLGWPSSPLDQVGGGHGAYYLQSKVFCIIYDCFLCFCASQMLSR